MAQTTITCVKSAYIKPGLNSPAVTNNPYISAYNDNIQAQPITAVLQFNVPSSLQYKRIIRATLNFYQNKGSADTATGSGLWAAPYIAGDVLSSLTYYNVNELGSLGELVTYEPRRYGTGETLPRWRSADVTDIYVGNTVNGKFTVFVNAYPNDGGILPSSYWASVNGATASNPAYITIDYEDVEQLPPTPAYPKDVYVNENTDLLFSWNWNATTEAVQASARLEYKLQSADTYTVVNISNGNHYYTLAGGLAQGSYVWRVKATNDAGETSDYSELATFNVIGKPAAPVIATPTNNTRTTITWNASDQNAFDIRLTDANGNVLVDKSIGSSETSYKPNMFLANGSYTVAVRVRNSTGLLSDWSYKTFTISATGPAAATMTVEPDGDRVTVKFTSGNNVAIMRQKTGELPECLAIIDDASITSYTDTTCASGEEYAYFVRTFSTGYTDTPHRSVTITVDGMCLKSGDTELHLKTSEDEFLPYEEDIERNTTLLNFSGREFYFLERGEFTKQTFRREFFVNEREKSEISKLLKVNRAFYRDSMGQAFACALTGASYRRANYRKGYIVTLTLVRLENEEVEVNV